MLNHRLDHTNDLFIFQKKMKTESKKESLIYLNKLIKQYGALSLFSQTTLLKLTTEEGDFDVSLPILSTAVRNDNDRVVSRLLACGASIDQRSECVTNPNFDHVSPLMFACERDNKKIINILLEHNPNLLQCDSAGRSLLMYVKSIKACNLIIEKARELGCLNELLSITDQNEQSAFNYAAKYKTVLKKLTLIDKDLLRQYSKNNDENNMCIVLKRMIKIRKDSLSGLDDDDLTSLLIFLLYDGLIAAFTKCIEWKLLEDKSVKGKLPVLLHYARVAYWDYPEQSAAFDDICVLLKKQRKKPKLKKVVELNTDAGKLRISNAYHTLFGSKDRDLPQTEEDKIKMEKENKIKTAIAQFYSLLGNPKECIKYLKFLNSELIRYFEEKHKDQGCKFPYSNKKYYKFELIDRTYYPVPKNGYKKTKRSCALQEFLVALLKQHGMGNKAYKWIGFIPYKKANKMVKKGDMIIESQLGMGLFHNKLSHILQLVILIYAIQHGKIKLPDGITIHDISRALVTMKQDNSTETIWQAVRDSRDFSTVSFSDPFRLGSIVMRHGKALGMRALSDSLIDAHCHGFLRLYQLFKEHDFYLDNDMSLFLEHLNDLQTLHFVFPKFVLTNAIRAEVEKGTIKDPGHNEYACVPKDYEPFETFEPRDFGAEHRPINCCNIS